MEQLDQLIRDCAANDRRSQEKLYRQFYPQLFLLCKRLFADDHHALEALNDGMMKVFRNISSWRSDKGAFFNWMYTIIRNTAIDKCRVNRTITETRNADTARIDTGTNPFHSLEWKDIYRLLDTLTPATRVICNLFYLEGFTINEISIRLGVSPGTVKWHLNEARRKLKPVLKQYYG